VAEFVPDLYEVITRYITYDRKTVGEVLDNKDQFYNMSFIECEGDAPSPVDRCIAYLETLNRQEKIWLLEYDDDLNMFSQF